MKPLLVIIVLLAISCKKQEIDSLKTNLPVTKEVNSEINDWDKFEDEVFQTIENVKKLKGQERRKNILRFISFADKVDGSVAEGYCNFAFDYIENNPKDFFSVLTENDSIAISKWSRISSNEVALIGENAKEIDSLWIDIRNNHIFKRRNLDSVEIKLDELYLKKLKIEIDKY